MIYDYIIIGGGISGLYLFYNLKKTNKDLKILLFEKNNYLGGRIKTNYLKFKSKNYIFEEGAGRLNNYHKKFLRLIKELNLEDQLIKIKSNTEFYPSKGYKLDNKLKNKSFFDYIQIVLKKSKNLKKEELIKLSFFDLAKKYLTKDESDFLIKSTGYYSRTIKMNAYDSIKLFKNGIRDDIKYYIMKDGFSQIIKELLKNLDKRKIYINHEVKNINYNENIFELDVNNKKYKTIKVICAIPKVGLTNINYFNKHKNILNNVITSDYCRIYAIFNKDDIWYKNYGKFTTNNRLKYIIPISKENGLIMISYTDNINAKYWKKYINDENNLKEKIVEDVKDIFNKNIEKPIYTKICYWENKQNYWKAKVDSIKISNRVMKLDKNKELYIIGEGYSEKQGWVEGALENCEKFLKKYKIICK